MKCDPRKLSYYLDGELSPDEIRQLQQHLETCARCADDLARYRRMEHSIRRLERHRPPAELRHEVYREIERGRVGRWRRGWSRPLLSPAVPLTAAFILAAGAAAVWRLQPTGTAPVMTAAFAVQESPESLEGLRLELVFDRPVAPDSVAEAVRVDPPLSFTHRVQENKVELIPQTAVTAGSSYTIVVDNVRDRQGNVQSEPVVLSLNAGPIASLVQESSPPRPPSVPTADAGEPKLAQAEGARSAPEGAVSDVAPTQLPASTGPAGPPAPDGAMVAVASPRTSQATATVTAAAVAAAPAAEARSTVVPTPSAPAPTARPTTVRVSPESVAMTIPPLRSPTPAASRDASPDAPELLLENPDVQRQLGSVTSAPRQVPLSEQAYQGGAMLYRGDNNQILVLVRSTARWQAFPNTWRPGEVLAPLGNRPPGTFEPLRGFGKLWRDQPAVKNQLGWPVYEERSALGTVQSFQKGALIRSTFGVAYALFDDTTWRALPDARR